MSRVFVKGLGAVSAAGWGVRALRNVWVERDPLPVKELPYPGCNRPLRAHAVPPPEAKRSISAHARLRRTSPIAQYAVAAAVEALGEDVEAICSGSMRLGIVYCVMAGCVNYSRRFYDETLKDPSTASPVIFPETVFNAPSSHLGALLGSHGINYTLVGDPGTFVQGLALAADWLLSGRVDGCLVIGAEELDWLIAGAFNLFDPEGLVSEGAGALYLSRTAGHAVPVELCAVTQPYSFSNKKSRAAAALKARAELGDCGADSLLCDSTQGIRRLDQDENEAWAGWKGARCSPKLLLGEAFVAAAAWQCVVAVDALAQQLYPSADVSVVGCNQQAIAARFGKS